MSREVVTVQADDSLLDVARIFIQNPFKRYPVMHDHEIVGVLSRHNLMRALLGLYG